MLCQLLISFQLQSSLSVASIRSAYSDISRSLASLSSSKLSKDSAASVASVLSESIASEDRKWSTRNSPLTTTLNIATESDTGNSNNNNNNNNVALVGGVVGAVLGTAVLGLVGLLLWRRKRNGASAPLPARRQPFFGQQLSSQPITPASMTFSANSNGPPVTHAAQPRSHPQQSLHLALPRSGSPTGGQTSTASQRSASSDPAVRTWVENPSSTYQGTNANPASPSRLSPASAEGPVNSKEFYSDALRAPTYHTTAPANIPSSSSGVWNPPSHAPPSSLAPPYSPPRNQGLGRFGG